MAMAPPDCDAHSLSHAHCARRCFVRGARHDPPVELTSPQLAHGGNAGLDKMVAKLEPIKQKFSDISYADLYILAGATALESSGVKVPFKAGRVDAMSPDAVTPDGRLPDASKGNDPKKTAAALRMDVFYRMGYAVCVCMVPTRRYPRLRPPSAPCPPRPSHARARALCDERSVLIAQTCPPRAHIPSTARGLPSAPSARTPRRCSLPHCLPVPPRRTRSFNDREIVALSGAHALGRCHPDASGYSGPWTPTPYILNNGYFNLLLALPWTIKEWDGPMQFEDPSGRLMMLPSDIVLIQDKVRASSDRAPHGVPMEPCFAYA